MDITIFNLYTINQNHENKILITFNFHFPVFSFNLKAQDDANCGIVINGVLADSITCWSFDNMYIVFPVKPEFKKYKTYTLGYTILLTGKYIMNQYQAIATMFYTFPLNN